MESQNKVPSQQMSDVQARLQEKANSLNRKEERFRQAGCQRIYWTPELVAIFESYFDQSTSRINKTEE